MIYGNESWFGQAPAGCVTGAVAASRWKIPAEQIEEYAREGLLIPLKSRNGVPYYTDADYAWIKTIQRLREEAHLSLKGIRELVLGGQTCRELRRCEVHNTESCPRIADASKPCWVTRASWNLLGFYPCYSCLAYRTLPFSEAVREALEGVSSAEEAEQ